MDNNVVCERCSEPFYKWPSWLKRSDRHFCSKDCRNKTIKIKSRPKRKTGEILKCYNCEISFYRRKSAIKSKINFCSRICRDSKPVPQEIRDKISAKRKAYLAANPEKHVWKRHDKFKSVPCEKLKELLRQEGIPFTWELEPSAERFFSIDIAFPDLMIGLEINGNQHYLSDGSLKPYYQERQDYLEKLGWKVYQIHYSLCFNKVKIMSIVKDILKLAPPAENDSAFSTPITAKEVEALPGYEGIK